MDEEQNRGVIAATCMSYADPDEIDAGYCLEFLRTIRDCSFATVNANGLPSVRIIDVMHVEDGKLYFLAPRGKAFHAELVANPVVAVVGQTADFRTCRLRGKALRPADRAEQQRLVDMLFDLNPSLNVLYPGDARYICDAFYIQDASGDYFDLGCKPLVRVEFCLGAGFESMGVRYEITRDCTRCGACVDVCPQACIGCDVEGCLCIDQAACLRCGLCLERCEYGAIERR